MNASKKEFLILPPMNFEIKYIVRKTGKLVIEKVPAGKMMKFLNHNPFGKLALNILIKRKIVSSLYGWIMNTSYSKKWIHGFRQKYNMSLNEYVVPQNGFKTFNDFFYRHVKPESRPIGNGLVSPADGKILVFQEINEYQDFFVKGGKFNIGSYMKDNILAKKFEGGSMLIVRLAPTDYHRFHFPASGKVTRTKLINGFYHSVSPIALDGSLEKFFENKRTICVQDSEEFGKIAYSDVGATMVGSIIQTYTPETHIDKGAEKGFFAFGGSTVVLFFEKGKIQFDQDLIDNTKNQIETAVLMGETIGRAIV